MTTPRTTSIPALTAFALSGLLFGSSCGTSRALQGGAIGTGAGAGIGAVIGNQFGDNGTVIGALIGAAVGGTTGALIGRHMDKQAEELRNDLQGATVTRVGEGIRITFDSGLLFAVDQSTLNATAQKNLGELASTLNKYDDTEVLIEGHTDADGADDYNESLSLRRAQSVERYLAGKGVRPSRTSTMGYGESQPIGDNSNADAKAANRRVEIAIYANSKMKKAAERGELGDVQ
ncbi:MAG: OmpA family protein [Flavobacteriales bacterium]|nr:OmpA family protein [Flavobacteriales bacterium]MBK6753028.1 OmpA family protein [Flavobacteriales bacterium]MBK7085710.1 OmpA family protein [Flavobacteriales bacterium]MBK7268400.1 OmpA family protein [Flavobacteriales bacterium]MBK7752768.1 OmpA family protein [Flavobacteriales bacterium]